MTHECEDSECEVTLAGEMPSCCHSLGNLHQKMGISYISSNISSAHQALASWLCSVTASELLEGTSINFIQCWERLLARHSLYLRGPALLEFYGVLNKYLVHFLA